MPDQEPSSQLFQLVGDYTQCICSCSELCKNPQMMELTVPLPLPNKELACAENIAAQLDLLTEMVCSQLALLPAGSDLVWFVQVPGGGLRVYKCLIPEMEEFLESH